MNGVDVYRTGIAREWIDFNGHLRDAYYGLIVSLASDAFMERVGLDEAYRNRTRCTLYTLEMHLRFLREVKQTDVVDVSVRILRTDRKLIRAAFDLRCERYPDPVASAELVLMHVHQGEQPKGQSFPPEIVAALGRFGDTHAVATADGTPP